jgi:transcriptional regulator with XRE-family HTH domain
MALGLNDLVNRVAKRLAVARRQRGLSQEGLAAMLGIAVKNLQRIESGKQNLSLATLERICAALGITAETLLSGAPAPAERLRLPPILERLSAAGYQVRATTARGRRPANAVPVLTLRAASSSLGGVAQAAGVIGWVMLPRNEPSKDQFVAEVRGKSGEPRVQSGALCLFGPPGARPFRDRILLVSHDSFADDELGGPLALKRVKSAKRERGGVTRFTLESIEPGPSPLVIDARQDELRIIAKLVRVLVTR